MFHVDFLPGGNADQYLRAGWSFQEAIGIWAIDAESSMVLPAVESLEPYRITIKLFPLLHPPQLMRQRVELFVNGQSILRDELVRGRTRLSCTIARGLLRTDSDNLLVISHPDATSPRDIAPLRSDPRKLAVCVTFVMLEQLSPLDAEEVNRSHDLLDAPKLGQTDSRGLVFCVGSPIAREVVQILRSFATFHSAVDVRFAADVDAFKAAVASLLGSDRDRLVGVWQELNSVERNEAVKLNGLIPQRAAHVIFPRLFLNHLWPLQGHDPRLIPEPWYPRGRYPYTDIAGAQLRNESAHLNDETLYAAYLELSTKLMPNLEDKKREDEANWQALDFHCDIKVAEYIKENFERERLFYSPHMPAAPLLIYLAEHLIGTALSKVQHLPSDVLREFSDYIHGYQGMFQDQAPIHPYVLKTWNLPGVTTEYEYRREYSRRTFRQHILDYIRWAPWFAGGRARDIEPA